MGLFCLLFCSWAISSWPFTHCENSSRHTSTTENISVHIMTCYCCFCLRTNHPKPRSNPPSLVTATSSHKYPSLSPQQPRATQRWGWVSNKGCELLGFPFGVSVAGSSFESFCSFGHPTLIKITAVRVFSGCGEWLLLCHIMSSSISVYSTGVFCLGFPYCHPMWCSWRWIHLP